MKYCFKCRLGAAKVPDRFKKQIYLALICILPNDLLAQLFYCFLFGS